MRRLNRTLVLDVLKTTSTPVSRASISELTSLAKPTVSEIVEGLIADGSVREVGTGPAQRSGGRPPKLLEFDGTSQFVAGIHIGSHTTTVVIGDATGREIARELLETTSQPAEATLDRIGSAVMATARRAGVDPERFAAAGVVVPGLIDFHAGICLVAPNIGWRDVPVADILRKQLHFEVFVHNVSQAAVVAETVEGAAKGESDVVLIYGGSGVGAGILSGGRVFHGSGGITGEIGHCSLPGETRRCNCGKVGCLETVAGMSALVRQVWEGIADGRASKAISRVRRKDLSPHLIRSAALSGDSVAQAAITTVARNLGIGASWLVNIINPAVLVVAGSLAEFDDLVVDPVRQTVKEMAMERCYERLIIRRAELGQDAEVRGGVLLALQHAESYYRVVFQD